MIVKLPAGQMGAGVDETVNAGLAIGLRDVLKLMR
jgi:hypothetical protein